MADETQNEVKEEVPEVSLLLLFFSLLIVYDLTVLFWYVFPVIVKQRLYFVVYKLLFLMLLMPGIPVYLLPGLVDNSAPPSEP